MSNTGNRTKWEPIREIDASSLSLSYQVLGGIFTRDSFRVWITNNTNGDIYLSDDGVNNKLKIPALSGRAYDNKTNDMYMGSGTQWQIKWVAAPGAPAGWVGLEVEYV